MNGNHKLNGIIAEYGFTRRDEGDHTFVIRHTLCGEELRFSQTGATAEGIRKACEEHIGVCPKCRGRQ